MKLKQLKSSYEAPVADIRLIEVEGLLCTSTASGQNESFDDYEKDYTFTFIM